MKKFLTVISLLFVFVIGANAQQFPFGDATYTATTTDSLTLSFTPTNLVEFIHIDSTALDTNMTLNIANTYSVRRGAQIYITATADGSARTITFGTNVTGVANEVTATKTDMIHLVYDGTVYRVVSAIQND